MQMTKDRPREEVETPDATLASLIQWVESAEDEGQRAREASERDRDYYDGRQITHAEATALKARRQPVLAFNLTKGKVDYLLGLEKQQRSDPKAYPRTPNHEKAAEAATDGIRYVCDVNAFQQIASQVWENMVVEGAGGVDVCVEPPHQEGGDWRIVTRVVHWDRMIWDPHSRERDFSDAKYLGIVLWMDDADAIARWPEARDALDFSYESVGMTETWDDRPRFGVWADPTRKRVRIVQMYWREGDEWKTGTFTRGGWLESAQTSTYVDERGKPCCPLEYVSAYVNRENWRYGVVRDLIDPQDEINKRHQKAVHLLSVRQVIAEQGAVTDVDAARQELAKPDGYIEVAPGMRFEIQQTSDLSSGQAGLLQEAKSLFQVMGPNAALLGKQGSEASGRAIALSQQGGAMEIGAILDVHRAWRRRVYRAIWNRIRQYWTAEKWVRVTDDENNLKWVGLNLPVTLGEKLMQMPQAEAAQMVQMLGITEGDPRLSEVVEVDNEVAGLDVDIVVEEGPDVATLQQEEFAKITDLARAGVPIPPKALIQASAIRGKDKIIEQLETGGRDPNAPPPPPPPEVVKAQAEAEEAQARAQIAKAEAMEAMARVRGMMPAGEAAPAQTGPDPRVLDVMRKARRDQAEMELANKEFGLEAIKTGADLMPPPVIPQLGVAP